MSSYYHDRLVAVALEAHQKGWVPIPLQPNSKAPSRASWTYTSYSTSGEIEEAFTQQGTGNAGGIGLLLGEQGNGLVDIDLDHPLIAKIAQKVLPPTAMKSGRDGYTLRHMWYRVTDTPPSSQKWHDNTLDAQKNVILELRSSGGQTMIPPTIHPDTKVSVEWIGGGPFGGTNGPRALPALELEFWTGLVAALYHLIEAGIGEEGVRHAAYLALAGGLLRWSGHPNAVHPVWDHFIEFTLNALRDLTEDREDRAAEVVSSTRDRLLAGKEVQGFTTLRELLDDDYHVTEAQKAFRALELLQGYEYEREARTEERVVDQAESRLREALDYPRKHTVTRREPPVWRERSSSWESVQLSEWADYDLSPPVPSILRFTNEAARGVMYPNAVNLLFGKSNIGKSWIALHLALEGLVNEPNGDAMYIDLEDDPTAAARRLRLLGASWAQLERFHYVQPDGPMAAMLLTGIAKGKDARDNEEAFKMMMLTKDPSLIVVDGMTELYAMHGLDTNASTDTAKITRWLKSLTAPGRTVVIVDHEKKSAEKGAWPLGSQHKVSMVQGTALQLWCTQRPKLGQDGQFQLILIKDRHGEVAKHGVGDDPTAVADMVLSAVDGAMAVQVSPATFQMEVNLTERSTTYPAAESDDDQSPAEDEPGSPAPLMGRKALIWEDVERLLTETRSLTRGALFLGLSEESRGLVSSDDALSVLLREWKKEGRLTMEGSKRGSRYALAPAP